MQNFFTCKKRVQEESFIVNKSLNKFYLVEKNEWVSCYQISIKVWKYATLVVTVSR